MTRKHGLAAVAVTVAALAATPAADAVRAETFEVTFTDLTSGQPLTPAVAATHRGKNELFRVGSAASFGLKEIAENGNNAPMLSRLADDDDVFDVVEAPGGPLVPAGSPGDAMFGQSTTFSIEAERGARFLSLASMLICTNDGFTGVNSLKLPSRVGPSVTVETAGYDAGTELNTEDFADIVPPCQSLIGISSGEAGTGSSNPALTEGGVIAHHRGIVGGADLVPAVHGWDVNAPVARITVTSRAYPCPQQCRTAPPAFVCTSWRQRSNRACAHRVSDIDQVFARGRAAVLGAPSAAPAATGRCATPTPAGLRKLLVYIAEGPGSAGSITDVDAVLAFQRDVMGRDLAAVAAYVEEAKAFYL